MGKKTITWHYAVTTHDGIYNGTVTGYLEPGETEEQGCQQVSTIAQNFLREQGVTSVLACFVSPHSLHIDAPNTDMFDLELEKEFQA